MLGQRPDSGFRPAVERVMREAPPPTAPVVAAVAVPVAVPVAEAVAPLADEDGEVVDNSAQEGGKRSRASSESLASDRPKRKKT